MTALRFLSVVVAASALCGCRAPDCDALARAGEHADAARVCAQRYERRGEASAALRAARALLALGERARAVHLAERLYDGPAGAEALRIVGGAHLADDRFELARPLLERALALHLGAREPAGAAAAAVALVTGYWNANDFPHALAAAELARAQAAAAGDRALEAKALVAYGAVLHSAGDIPRASEAYLDAGELLAPDARRERADLLIRRAAMYADERQASLARPLLEQARALAAELGAHDLTLAAEVNLAYLALTERELPSAEAHLERAEAAARAQGRRQPSQGILLNRALLARLRGQDDAALAALTAVAATDPPPEVTWIIAHERAQLARARGQVALAESYLLEAIAIVEKMWRELGPQALRAPFFEDRWQPYTSLFALRVQVGDPLGALSAALAAQGRMFMSEAIEAEVAVSGRRFALAELGAAIAQTPLAGSPGAAQALAALGERYVLDYFSDGERLRLLVLDRGVVRIAANAVPLAELDKLVDAFLAAADDPVAARALGEAILPPAVLAAAPRRLVVVPHGALLRVPFAALRVGTERLVDQHELAYAPSVAQLAAGAHRERASGAGLLLGATRGELTHVAAEIDAVAALTGAAALVGETASVAALRGAATAPLLHIAGHSAATADGAHLVLADGQVSAEQILRWKLRPRLVVLASCSSGASARRELWGSLAVAFLAAGSEHVVATLQSVRDEVAAAFTVAFYRAGGLRDPVAAVRAAQLELSRSWPASQWAAFTVLGL